MKKIPDVVYKRLTKLSNELLYMTELFEALQGQAEEYFEERSESWQEKNAHYVDEFIEGLESIHSGLEQAQEALSDTGWDCLGFEAIK